jgi:raffinose/stachyose/melibiose transport system permease protein
MNPDIFVGLDNYKKLFSENPYNIRFWNAFRNNLYFFAIVMLVQNGMGFILAVMLTRKGRGLHTMRILSFLPTTLSVIVVGFLFSMMLNPTWGIINTILEAIGLGAIIRPWLGDPATALPIISLAVSWQFMGEAILFYCAGIDSINPEILEAGKIDGVSFFQEIRFLIIPSLIPVIGIVTIMIFVGDFTQFDIVYAMATTRGNPAYATDIFGSLFYRTAFQSPSRGGWGLGMGAAVSTVMTILVFIGVSFWLYIFNRQKKKNFQD